MPDKVFSADLWPWQVIYLLSYSYSDKVSLYDPLLFISLVSYILTTDKISFTNLLTWSYLSLSVYSQTKGHILWPYSNLVFYQTKSVLPIFDPDKLNIFVIKLVRQSVIIWPSTICIIGVIFSDNGQNLFSQSLTMTFYIS